MNGTTSLQHRLRRSALLIALGLVVQAGTLGTTHALSFVVFLLVGGTLVGAGILLYLLAIVSR